MWLCLYAQNMAQQVATLHSPLLSLSLSLSLSLLLFLLLYVSVALIIMGQRVNRIHGICTSVCRRAPACELRIMIHLLESD